MQATLVADELTVSYKRGLVYGPISFSADDGLTVICGPAGSGRTSLLLTLAGRMRPTSGTLSVLGEDLPRRARRVQRRTGVSGFHGIDSLEESVTVGAAIRERHAWLAPWWSFIRAVDDAEVVRVCAPVFGDIPVPAASTMIWDLDEVEMVLLRASLAMMSRPSVLFFDQVEQVHSPEARRLLWARLGAIVAAGTPVIASAIAPDYEMWAGLGLEPTVQYMNQEIR
ncbi:MULTISPECIES: ATP-binding cassette domain-containing protein [unclassified Cryobacterium]|uniref:ATP-binding cassette domain-containing protein n=1 Tax=unclassified Cryobacterium TaxID=2649013 RepID=UPI00106A37B4|nr:MULTISPECIES: ATP-binding cassette domain-containing protein [unclassified Cryobacterium]TFB93765.1 ATP-binding cassette domain-containing protein [Cryobacterium sp. MDB2-A-1]TFC09023.1 ATP-binding cassette domain-containing protein [Cryobacterium sp. MDB2-33-2]TFC14803.1 ATP-binding cassette domain-containing protein [Cryobacterium sp. MDB2-A-2]TFC16570.1 ATP-binding cassette domain-containing protein [Cryobacterium sp. MDB2-10]